MIVTAEATSRPKNRVISATGALSALGRLVLDRKRHTKDRAVGLVRRRRQPPAMRLDDRAADRQPHAHPVGLGRIEGLEQAVEVRRVEPRAGVLYLDEHIIRTTLAGDDRKLARSVADASYRLDGVDDQIGHHLLQLHPICRNKRQTVRKLGLQADAVPLHFDLGQGDDLANSLVDVQAFPARRRFPDECANPVYDLAGAVAVPDNAVERLSDFPPDSAVGHRASADLHWRW